MKKIIAMFAVLATCAFANAQGLASHPDARNDRMPSTQTERSAHHVGKRAHHHRAKHHHHGRKHHQKKHNKM